MIGSLLRRLSGAGSATAAVVLTTSLLAIPASAAPARTGAPVVLLGTGGLRWEDIGSSTPALFAALSQDAAGSLAVRSVRDSTCPVDGWLAVSAGRRAADAPHPASPTDAAGCRLPSGQVPLAAGRGVATGWDTYRAEAAGERFGADPGLLGSTLEAAGVGRAAVGPGALVATADRQGRTPAAWPGLPPGPGGTIDPGGDAVGLAGQVRAAVTGGARLIAVDLGAVRDPGPAAGTDPATGPATRDEQVAALDTRLGLVRTALPTDATVIIASLADDGSLPHLQVILASGPTGSGATFAPGLLRASSTRQDGLVQSTDLLPTLLSALGLPVPAGAVGSRLTRVEGGDDLDRLRRGLDLDQAALAVERLVTPFFVGYGIVELLVLAGLALVAVRSRARPAVRRRALVGLRIAAVTFALAVVGTFLANLWPWWRGSPAGPPLTIAVVTATLPLVGLVFAGPWRRSLLGPAGVAGALTTIVLMIDLVAGSPLALTALIGGQPIIAGRFYGLSNPTFALFATGAWIAALALAEYLLASGRSPRQAGLAVAAVGVVATVVDAAPSLGSDFGGPPALVPAFGLLALWVAEVHVTWRRLTALAAATVGVLLAVASLDWLRPADQRTHLGRFVQSVLEHEGLLIVRRKAEQNLDILVSTPLTLTIPVATALIVALLWRPARWRLTALQRVYDRQPLLPAGLKALGVLLLLGFAANDSGTSIPPGALMLLAPLLIEISARAVQRDDAERLERELRAARRPAKR